ncbi:MAG: hypothetical protein M9894_38635 [Planctomycetes bacterium]|nr:hypothetical protein [Planctomycetota bacterium]
MAEQDPAERLAAALVEELHGDHGEALEAAAAEGALLERFGEQVQTLRDTFARRFDEAALGGRDPLGEALRALAGRFGPAGQVPLREGAAPAPAPEAGAPGSGDDAARCARLRAALREARRRVRRLEAENQALREELLSAGEMIETLALDLEKPIAE